MGDFLRHECGIAMIRLRKPLAYYRDRYGSWLYGFQKLFVLMEKQYHRGHDGMGIGAVKLDVPLGQPYVYRSRSARRDSLPQTFQRHFQNFEELCRRKVINLADPESVKRGFPYAAEILAGHLRYGTSGLFNEGSCHPYLRRSNWPTKSLMILGNFNMTNIAELNQIMIERGQHPVFGTDTQTVLEEIGFHLDEVHTELYRELRDEGVPGADIPERISPVLDIVRIVRDSAAHWDGGYVIAGVVGNGDLFALRDPRGIRPCHYFENEELVAFASERVPLMTVFDVPKEEVHELEPGCVAVVKRAGGLRITPFTKKLAHQHCPFERIYFSRGNDPDIYQERKALGDALVEQILRVIDNDLEHTVLSFVPNTAETAYYGLMEGLRRHRRNEVKQELLAAMRAERLTEAMVDDLILRNWPRGEKVAHKDIKMRTFISQEKGRDQMVSHVYDITYGLVTPDDNLVVLDDSIVRGTTLRKSILQILARTRPKRIIIVSTAPQIRYPDCYGIDMSELGKFIAFQAAVELLKKRSQRALIESVYAECVEELKKPVEEMRNCVKRIYEPLTAEEISAEIGAMVYPQATSWHGEVVVVFQTVENLARALPEDSGMWYFTGDYPTPGGYAVVNRAFVHYHEQRSGRVYDLLFAPGE